jgi:hypothetical protein
MNYKLSSDGWIINGCTLHNSVNVEYCKNICRMKEHCQVYLDIQKNKVKEKVTFT